MQDWSAMCVLEVDGTDYKIVDLKHKQHQPYNEIVAWAKHVYENPRFGGSPVFLIDIGGVGKALQDQLTAEGVKTTGIQLTGSVSSVNRVGPDYHVSKTYMIGKFLAAWDADRVQRNAFARFRNSFDGELKAFRGKMSSMGRAQFEAAQGEHDDQVIAVAMAVWYGEHTKSHAPSSFVFVGELCTPPWKGVSDSPELSGE
jgi:hypothetical protein